MSLPRLVQVSIVLLLLQISATSAEPIIIQGSTTFARHLLANQKEKLEADSGQTISLIPNKSLPGIVALVEGRAHVAMISAPLENELAALKELLPTAPDQSLIAHEIKRVPVAIVVNPENRVRRASLDQIKGIWLGEITNWSELGVRISGSARCWSVAAVASRLSFRINCWVANSRCHRQRCSQKLRCNWSRSSSKSRVSSALRSRSLPGRGVCPNSRPNKRSFKS